MKTWMKVVLGIVAAIALVVGAVFYFTSGITQVGDDFFAEVRDDNMDGAYDLVAKDFQAGISRDALAEFLADEGMDDVTETSWSSRAITNGTGTLSGSLTTARGRTVPVTIDLIKEGGSWKIYSIRKSASGVSSASADTKLPSEAEQVALVNESMAVFADSIAANNMAALHSYGSQLWQKQFDTAALEEAFKGMYAIGSGFQSIKKLSPAFDVPTKVDDDGVMEIEGHYPTSPNRTFFEIQYVYEGTGWKMLGITVEVK